MNDFYTTQDVANIFKVTAKTIRNWDKEKVFVPCMKINDERYYNRVQIEQKLGCSIEEALDQIKFYNQEDFDRIKNLSQRYNLYFYTGLTRVEQYCELYITLHNLSVTIWRANKIGPANCIILCPEISGLIETCAAGFVPSHTRQEIANTMLIGTLNNKFKIYSSIFLDMNEILIGFKGKNGLVESSDNLFFVNLEGANIM